MDDESFSHVDGDAVEMVDVSGKDVTARVSVARGRIGLRPETVSAIEGGDAVKGNVLATARVAAIQAVKHTWETIPMCHSIPISGTSVEFSISEDHVETTVEVRTEARTGVEMEALCGASTALLTVWDMVKSAEKNADGEYPETRINDLRVVEKRKESVDD